MKTSFKCASYQFDADIGCCRICGATLHQHRIEKERYLDVGQYLYLCEKCGHLYLTPSFTDETLTEFYANRYRSLFDHETQSGDLSLSGRRLFEGYARIRAFLIAEFLPPESSVLEIGSGYGAFLGQLHKRRPDLRLFAIEPDEKNREMLLENAPVQFVEGEDAAVSFNLIVAFHVFEHLKDPVDKLLRLSKALAQSGKIVIEVPDVEADWISWNYVHSAHLSYFSKHSLQRTINRAGMTCEYIGTHPCGKPFGDTIWAVISKGILELASIDVPARCEIDHLRAHALNYPWTWKDATKHKIKDFLLSHNGGALVRFLRGVRTRKTVREFFEKS